MPLEDSVSLDSDAVADEKDYLRLFNNDELRQACEIERSRLPPSIVPHSVSPREAIMSFLNKRQKKNANGRCFYENARSRFLHNFNKKSPISRVLTIEKYNKFVGMLSAGIDASCPKGLQGWQRSNCERFWALIYISII